MRFDATDIQTLILNLTWYCIDVAHWINPRFRAVFPSLDHLAAVFPTLGITFCDGLLDVVQSATPPSINWFFSLPTDLPHRKWGIYVLVLRKGNSFKIYIGSGTSTINNGVRYRILQHKGRRVEPRHVKNAKDAGYKQVLCSLLAWCDTPTPARIPVFRTAIVAIEAAFHLIFWPMYNPTNNYSFPDGPWDRKDYEWQGLCSHNPLTEGVIDGVDNIEYTAEQLEYMATVAAERRRAVRRAYDKKLRANKTAKYSAYRLAASRRSQVKVAAKGRLAIAAKTYHCDTCNITCRDQAQLRRHNDTDRHKASFADGCGLYCEPCNYQAKDRSVLHRHQSSARHTKRCREAAAAAGN